MSLPTVREPAALRERIGAWRAEGRRVALVATMGALHAGHVALVARGLAECDRVVASVFVNPRQFGASEDLSAYPRDLARDAAVLAGAGAHLLYAPDVAAMYPDGFATTVSVEGPLTSVLDGPRRPGHFAGMATVVTKLLLQATPDLSPFGEKDWQQLQVVRRLVRDLDVAVRIVGVPTVREADGLAMASRNAYLSPAERGTAARLPAVLAEAAQAIAGGLAPDAAAAWAAERLVAAGFGPVDYVEARDPETLALVADPGAPARLFAAAWLGRTRLIDNVPVRAPGNG